LHKGPNLTGIDPLTDAITGLFYPRRDRWEEHFEWSDFHIVGKTGVGRATAAVLDMNGDDRLDLRLA